MNQHMQQCYARNLLSILPLKWREDEFKTLNDISWEFYVTPPEKS